MKVFRCEICKQLDVNDTDDKTFCKYGIDARQNIEINPTKKNV